MTEESVISAVGIFLTLASLIGTFFYIHLSTWYSDILQLKSKYDLNKIGETQERKEARLECRYELQRLLNHVPFLVTLVTASFVIFLFIIATNMFTKVSPVPESFYYYRIAFLAFLVIYLSLTGYLLVSGYIVGNGIRNDIKNR